MTKEHEPKPQVNSTSLTEPTADEAPEVIDKSPKISTSAAAVKKLSHGAGTYEESLKGVSAAQVSLAEVKNGLKEIINSIDGHKSFITKAAEGWGDMNAVTRVLIAVFLMGTPIAAAVLTQAAMLYAISAGVTFTFTAGAWALDDHNAATKQVKEDLKRGVYAISDILGWVIGALDNIGKKLGQEVDRLRIENQVLHKSVTEMVGQLKTLEQQVLGLSDTKVALEGVKDDLAAKVADGGELLEANQVALKQATHEHELVAERLSTKLGEMAAAQKGLTAQLAQSKDNAALLANTMAQMQQFNTDEKQAFEEFLQGKGKLFDAVTEKMSETSSKLASTQAELAGLKESYQQLLQQQEKLLARQELLAARQEGHVRVLDGVTKRATSLVSGSGFFAPPADKRSCADEMKTANDLHSTWKPSVATTS